MSDSPSTSSELARRAGLRYVTDEEPGIRRQRQGRGFAYTYDSGRTVRGRRQQERIKALAIPPAWSDVWICRPSNGHLQATGRDNKGRKQFLYHAKWHEVANEAKFQGLMRLGNALPRIRRKVAKGLRRRKPSREKMLALMVRLLDLTGMRIGHEEYVQQNGAHGLSTLRRKHLRINGRSAEFRFPGKRKKKRAVVVRDKKALSALRACAGKKILFCHRKEGRLCPLSAQDVNEFLHDLAGTEITAKDFRTWLASAYAAEALYQSDHKDSPRKREKTLVQVTKDVARKLGNTPAICRKSYHDPRLFAIYRDGRFRELFHNFQLRKRKWLRRRDQIFLHFLSNA